MQPINHEFLAFNVLHYILSRTVTYSCSTVMLLTPIMWCFLGSGGTLNILHQYSVSMVFGTVNCGQNKTHDQADMWRKCPISDLQGRCSLKLHLRPQLWEVSIILKYCIILRHRKFLKLKLLSASGDVTYSAVRRFYAPDISDGDWNWCLYSMTSGESSALQRLAEYFIKKFHDFMSQNQYGFSWKFFFWRVCVKENLSLL